MLCKQGIGAGAPAQGRVLFPTLVQARVWVRIHLRLFSHNLCSVPFPRRPTKPDVPPKISICGGARHGRHRGDTKQQFPAANGDDSDAIGIRSWLANADSQGGGSRPPMGSSPVSGWAKVTARYAQIVRPWLMFFFRPVCTQLMLPGKRTLDGVDWTLIKLHEWVVAGRRLQFIPRGSLCYYVILFICLLLAAAGENDDSW